MSARRRKRPADAAAPAHRARQSRRAAVLIGALAISGAAVAIWRLGSSPTAAGGPIILISIDTLRADHLPLYGYRKLRTPAIDALAADGVVFERAYAHSPQTLPSHTSILSGRLPFEHSVRDNIGFRLKPGERLLPHMLRDRGFATGAVVSAYVLRAETGINQGFDLFDANLPTASPELSIAQVQRDGMESFKAADRWMSGLSSPRFFLFFHIYEPHKPYAPPARYQQLDPYDGEIGYADEIVGRLLDSLRSRGFYDDATIVLSSDHGEGLGDHGEYEHGLFIYDETIRVPLVVKRPGARGGGRRIASPVQHIDLLPTILELVGAPRPPDLRGRSLSRTLDGESEELEDTGIYSESLYPRYHFGWSELVALTDRRYRFIRAPRDELYDLEQDPRETKNIAAERSQAAVAMRGAIDRLMDGTEIEPPSEVTAEEREKLEALGYIGSQSDVSVEASSKQLPDPKDKIATLEKYRRAVDFVAQRQPDEAVPLFREILVENPDMVDVWEQLGTVLARTGRNEEALAALKRMVALKPSDAGALVAVATMLLKLQRVDEARVHAELAEAAAADEGPRVRAAVQETLVRIALSRKDREGAVRHARLGHEADPSLPLPLYVEARLRHDAGRYAEALPLFERALEQLGQRTITMSELHFYLGDTLARLGRNAEAEKALLEEVRLFPQNSRARASLAMLYRSTGRDAAAEQAIDNLLGAVPTPEGYDVAAQLWTMFGEPGRAAAVQARARQRFGRTGAGTP